MSLVLLFRLCSFVNNGTYREEFFRLKKIQGKKKRDTEAAAAEMEAEREEGVEYSADSGIKGGAEGGADMLQQGKDEDVIF